ncbi:MAG: glycoside hydrolase family 2, partial [Bacteroidales bacterium]|nr:glycoside hydrolase family 2 [Bacteroidales bacterium]
MQVSFALKQAEPWAPAGFELAWDQMELPWNEKTGLKVMVVSQAPEIKEEAEKLIISGSGFQYTFDKNSGRLVTMDYQGKQLLTGGPRLNVWRAPLANETDQWAMGWSNLTNKTQGLGYFPASGWYAYGLDNLKFKLDKILFSKEGIAIKVEVWDHAEGNTYFTSFDNHYIYTIQADGSVNLEHTVTPQGFMPSWLPKTGLQWNMDKSMNQVNWYGRGPFETYPDRKTGAKINVYKSTVQDMKEPYLVPQDYGCR